jgi:hypothetical protein
MTYDILMIMGLIFLIIILEVVYRKIGPSNNSTQRGHHLTEENKAIYIFKYYYSYIGNKNNLLYEYLANWNITHIRNLIYILELTLAKNLKINKYLGSVWRGYHGREIFIEVYERTYFEDHTFHDMLIGYYLINGSGKVCVMQK